MFWVEKKYMDNKKIKLICTGGLGFIFSYVTEYFVRKGWDVLVIDDLSEGSHPEIIDGSFRFIQMDCADSKVQDLIIAENPDYIIHAAAISDVDFSIRDPEYILKQNIMANVNIFEAARFCTNLKKFLYVSTDEVYGECETLKTEADIIFPKNPYSTSKAMGSLMRIAYDNTYLSMKDKTCETRFCNVFGKRQDPRKILSRIKKSMEENTAVPVHNGGTGYREYIYVKNIPPLLDMLLEKGDRVYNVTLNDGYTVQDLIKKCSEVTNTEIKTTESHRPGMDEKYQMDATRVRELGWTPLYAFEEGLREYLLC